MFCTETGGTWLHVNKCIWNQVVCSLHKLQFVTFNSTLMAVALKFHATLQPRKTSSARNYLEVKLKEFRSSSWPLKTLGKSNIIRLFTRLSQVVFRELMLKEEEDEILCSFHVGRCEHVEIPCDEKRFRRSWWGHLDMCVYVCVSMHGIVLCADMCFLVWFSRLRDCHR